MGNCKNIQEVITATLAAGSTASPYFASVNLTKRLCRAVCAQETPSFVPSFNVLGWSQVGATQYVATIQVQGCVSYNPCGACCGESEPVNRTFTIPFSSPTAPTSVAVSAGTTVNAIVASPCRNCGRTFVSETALTLTVTTA